MDRDLTYHLHVAENVLQNPLPECTTLFFCKVAINETTGFCAVFGPTETCMPEHKETCELFYAKVALFDTCGVLIKLHNTLYGSKYRRGGGMVMIRCDKHGVLWTTSDERGCNKVFGIHIPPEDIFVAL